MLKLKKRTSNKVLVVEDDPDLNSTFKRALTDKGFSVNSVVDVKGALRSIKKERPGIILLDSHIPDQSKDESLKSLRQSSGDTPMVVFTDTDDKQSIEAAKDLGADRYILKDWSTPRSLVKMVKETLGHS